MLLAHPGVRLWISGVKFLNPLFPGMFLLCGLLDAMESDVYSLGLSMCEIGKEVLFFLSKESANVVTTSASSAVVCATGVRVAAVVP